MKNFFKGITLSILIFSISNSFAQELEITPYAGYMWGGDLRVYTGELRGSDGTNFGLSIDYKVAPGTYFEAFWFIQSGTMNYKEYGQWEDQTFVSDLTTNYFHIGILREMNEDKKFRPFGTFTLGTTIFDPKDSFYSSEWRFSLSLGAGAKYYFSDRIGLRIQGRFMMPMYFSGSGIWCSTGNCSYGVAATTIIAQADVTGGLIIVLK